MKENKEKKGKTIRFSIRIPKYQHECLKNKSSNTKGTSDFLSMNKIITDAIDLYLGLVK